MTEFFKSLPPARTPWEALWRAVLDQAFADSQRPYAYALHDINWFKQAGQSFWFVCENANADPLYIKRIVMPVVLRSERALKGRIREKREITAKKKLKKIETARNKNRKKRPKIRKLAI